MIRVYLLLIAVVVHGNDGSCSNGVGDPGCVTTQHSVPQNFCDQFTSEGEHLVEIVKTDGDIVCGGVVNHQDTHLFCADLATVANAFRPNQCKECKHGTSGGQPGDLECAPPSKTVEEAFKSKNMCVCDPRWNYACTVCKEGREGLKGCTEGETADPTRSGGACTETTRFTDAFVRPNVEAQVGQASSSGSVTIPYAHTSCSAWYDCVEDVAAALGLAPYRAYMDDEYTCIDGTCACNVGFNFNSDGHCGAFTCEAATSGSACKTCVPESAREKNNHCAECNDGFILSSGDCFDLSCTENPDEHSYHGCQHCRTHENRRHNQDCLLCANGYHFLAEQQGLVDVEPKLNENVGGLMGHHVNGKESGYCFAYMCTAGGNVDVDEAGVKAAGQNAGRVLMLTALVVTENDAEDRDPNVPVLSVDTLEFRDHCKTCVPQHGRVQDDHCASCNPGYYLDEMHHSCRKKTCGVPHFRRNAVTCYETADGRKLAPKPWSTPCTDCVDNSTEECCLEVDPQLFCGAQDVVCASGTEKNNMPWIPCGPDDCNNYSDVCCNKKTCENQQVACFPDQDRVSLAGDVECVDECYHGSAKCCTTKSSTCADKGVKCAFQQNARAGETPCTRCQDEGHECCEPVRKTCGNQGVVCHVGTYGNLDESCETGCAHFEDPCCGPKTCANQRVHCTGGKTLKDDAEDTCVECLHDSVECCNPAPPVQETCENQNVRCGEGLFRPGYTECSGETGTCNDDGLTCCYAKTCGNQNVMCSGDQHHEPGTKECFNNCDESVCCTDARTCGSVGVVCGYGNYRHADTPCDSCDNHDVDECCIEAKTCKNQGIICLPGTHKGVAETCTNCEHYGNECCLLTTCDNQQVACSPGRARKDGSLTCTNCIHDSDGCCDEFVRTCGNQNIQCGPAEYVDHDHDCGSSCVHYGEECCKPYTKSCRNQNVVCGPNQTPNTGNDCSTCANRGTECCTNNATTCRSENVNCRSGHYHGDFNTMTCLGCKNNDENECCLPLPKTCANQNVQCGYGLHKAQDGHWMSMTCDDCENFTSKDCCETVSMTCGNQGVQCRSDLYNASDVKCGSVDAPCAHNSTPCCEDPPLTCGSDAYVCKNSFYRPSTVVCPDGKCSDELCCHSNTCGNQNVKCADGTANDSSTPCNEGECDNYGTVCCESNTCDNANVQCDVQRQARRDGSTECTACVDNGVECCQDNALRVVTKTCDNKYGIGENDIKLNLFLEHWRNSYVSCDASQGYFHITENDKVKKGTACGGDANQDRFGNDFTECTPNDSDCCWRKTCKASDPGNDDVIGGQGMTQDGDSSFACPVDTHELVDHAEHVVCAGECDKVTCCVAKNTCKNQGVACSVGFERKEGWTTAECGDECVENSSQCCQMNTCSSRGVQCEGVVEAKSGNPTCLTCMDNGAECCEALQKTCLRERVHCGFGMRKVSNFLQETCDDCENDGEECCTSNTCEARGNDRVSVQCDGVNFALVDDSKKTCYHCVDNGAECCVPIVPDTTCRNQNVQCTRETHFYLAYLDEVCKDCQTNAEECCAPRTCTNKNLAGEAAHCGDGFTSKSEHTPCLLCLDNSAECCTLDEVHTCWSDKIVCPNNKYHKHPNLECDGDCTEEQCCAVKTCENQGVCCNANLGFSELSGLDERECTNCADNCAECCNYDTPTCASAQVGCGFGFHRKANSDAHCSTCAHNDAACCEPRTCGSDADIDEAFECPSTHNPVDETTRCHFCVVEECCVPKVPDQTCANEQVGCGHGFHHSPDIDREQRTCDSCALNDDRCCVPNTCGTVACGDSHKNKGGLCGFCTTDECCEEKQTCASANVGCGFGWAVSQGTENELCGTCALNDDVCCDNQTCGTDFALESCPANYARAADEKSCAFCELSECCDPVEPKHTCDFLDVGCGYGYSRRLHEPEDDGLAPACSTCELNDPICCASKHCSEEVVCPAGLKSNENVDQCGFCSSEECCVPDIERTCENHSVGCGFGFDYVSNPDIECSTCTHNDPHCCVQRNCEDNGPFCQELTQGGLPHTDVPNTSDQDKVPCTFCTKNECCVPPVVPKTCVNQGVVCSGGFVRHSDFMTETCGENCISNAEPCCEQKTCGDSGAVCDSDLFSEVHGFADKSCLVCASNALECCEPKLCGSHFLDHENECSDNHSTNSRNQPCVGCDARECCTPLPELRCTEIEIQNGQAFYTAPNGEGSERMLGSVLYVECDLGFKFEDREYKFTGDVTLSQQSSEVDYPVCRNPPARELHETNVIMFSPTTSGWDRAPPVCRPVTCPVLTVKSIYTPNAENLGRVVYRDAQMDENPNRGAGYNQRDYAAEADVACNEGYIRVPNRCVDETEGVADNMSENTLEWALKGFWRFEDNTADDSPHCHASKDVEEDYTGSCNPAQLVGAPVYVDGTTMDGASTKGLHLDGKSQFAHVEDDWNQNWEPLAGENNELDIDSDSWTASVWVKLDPTGLEHDGYLFLRLNHERQEVVTLKLDDSRVAVRYNNGQTDPRSPDKLTEGVWHHVLTRQNNGRIELFINGVLIGSAIKSNLIMDTAGGSVYMGADREASESVNNFLDGALDEVRWYSRGLTDKEVQCLAAGRTSCPRGVYYAKPYNTQACNRESEEIKTFEACRTAVQNLLADGILGNSLNGGERFGSVIMDVVEASGSSDSPTYCTYREEDAQVIFNASPSGRAHTSLAPICSRTPQEEPDMSEVGCLPKCLENGEWSVALPTCEKDWCNPVFEEWSCCANRADQRIGTTDNNNGKPFLGMDYYLKFHNQLDSKCPIGYGDCDHDAECLTEKGVEGLCSQRRDLDRIDVCITDLDPCYMHQGNFVSGTACTIVTAVGANYDTVVASGTATHLFLGGSFLILGALVGYSLCKGKKGDEYKYLLEEEL